MKKLIFCFLLIPSLCFAGVDLVGNTEVDYISTSLNLSSTSDVSVSLWFKADSTLNTRILWFQGGSDENGFGGAGATAADNEINISLGTAQEGGVNNRLTVWYGYGNTTNACYISVAFSDTSNWHHLVATFDNLNSSPACALFLDGVSQGTDTGADTDISNLTVNRIGGPASTIRFYDGKVEDVAVWSSVLSSEDITILAKSAVKGIALQVSPSTLLYYLPLDNFGDSSAISTTASAYRDLSANGYHGTGADGGTTGNSTNYADMYLTYP